MISFKRLGRLGRLGNQLFQYAFLRTTAQRLGVKFYCPHWIGEDIFHLNDSEERAENPIDILTTYLEPPLYTGFNQSAIEIEDKTDIAGWFQTERYWDRGLVKNWYRFREDKTCRVREKYKELNFAESVGMHLRFGDKIANIDERITYYVPPPDYYSRALSLVEKGKNVIVFSDEIEVAKKHLRSLTWNLIFIEDNEPYEDLYLMTRCHDFIISISTLSWWGALLNEYPDSIIIAPSEGPFRPGCRLKNSDYLCTDWIRVRALRKYIDYRLSIILKESFKQPREVLYRILQKIYVNKIS